MGTNKAHAPARFPLRFSRRAARAVPTGALLSAEKEGGLAAGAAGVIVKIGAVLRKALAVPHVARHAIILARAEGLGASGWA